MLDRQAEMRLMLRALRLPAIAAVYEDLAIKAAKANLTHEEFLYELLRAECLQRDESCRRSRARWRCARRHPRAPRP